MDRSILALVVMTLVVSGNLSFAATTTKTSANKIASKKKGVKKAEPAATATPAATTGQVAPAARPAQAAVITPAARPASSQGSTTISIAKATKEAKPSPWSFKYRTENRVGVNDVMDKQGEVGASDRAYVNYSLNDTTSLSLVQYIKHSWFGKREGSAADVEGTEAPKFLRMGDTYGEINNSNIAVLGDSGIEYSAGVRLTGGTSEESRVKGELGSVRFHNYLTKTFGNLTADIYVSPIMFAERAQTYTNLKGEVKRNNFFMNITGLELDYAVTSKFHLVPNIYYTNVVNQPDDAENLASTRADLLEIDAEIKYDFSKAFTMTFGLDNEVNHRALETAYEAFRPADTVYYLKADFKM